MKIKMFLIAVWCEIKFGTQKRLELFRQHQEKARGWITSPVNWYDRKESLVDGDGTMELISLICLVAVQVAMELGGQ